MSSRKSDGKVRKTYQFIEAHRHQFPVQVMCRVLGVAPSGYYEWLKHPISKHAEEDMRLFMLICASFVMSHGVYDLTGFFCPRLNVVFFNLDEGVNRYRTRSIAPSRRSQNCGKSTCWWAKACRSTKPARKQASRMSPTTAGARSMAA